MPSKTLTDRPPFILVVAVFLFLGIISSREAFEKEVLPVFSSAEQKKIYVELTFDGSVGGVYQINDDSTFCNVIKLTERDAQLNPSECRIPLVSGERFFLRKKARGIEIVDRGWMAAGKRIALSIPLHPDRMSQQDWPALPGVGEKLAEKIEKSRQNNGDFGSVSQLVRVKGIGEKSIEKWEPFFSGS